MSLPINLVNRVSQRSTRTLNQRIMVSEYGDGHTQVAALGINSRYDEWQLEFNNLTLALRNEFMNFYATVGMVKSWSWTPVDGVAGKYRIVEPPTENNDGCVYNISMKVKQVY